MTVSTRNQTLVIPAKAGSAFISAEPAIQRLWPSTGQATAESLDPRLRGNGSFTQRLRLTLQILALCLLFSPAFNLLAQAGTDVAPLQFNDAAEERRFRTLVSELRCVMCQNQSLSDSNAQIAYDLRREVLDLMRAGKTDAEVKEFLVARYGEFVLYKPRIEGSTWLLWFGPALLLVAGGFVIARIVRRRQTDGAGEVSADETQEW